MDAYASVARITIAKQPLPIGFRGIDQSAVFAVQSLLQFGDIQAFANLPRVDGLFRHYGRIKRA